MPEDIKSEETKEVTDIDVIAKAEELKFAYEAKEDWIADEMIKIAIRTDEGSKKITPAQKVYDYKYVLDAAFNAYNKALLGKDKQLIIDTAALLEDTRVFIFKELAQ
jgi:hypothetical protein